jgi:hypothetical protein
MVERIGDILAAMDAERAALTVHVDMIQGSDEWFEARRGLLTASEMNLCLTPGLKIAANEKTRAHVYEIAAQRISGFVEPHYVSDDMLRGQEDEAFSVMAYEGAFGLTKACGFMVRDFGDCRIGYSPDRLVGCHGLIECKSRRQRFQVETLAAQAVPPEYVLQCQTGLLVSGREWLDFVSYSGGLPMAVIRVEPDPVMQDAILAATRAFEVKVQEVIAQFHHGVRTLRTVPTERRVKMEIF